MKVRLAALLIGASITSSTFLFATDPPPCPKNFGEWQAEALKEIQNGYAATTRMLLLSERCQAELDAVPSAKACLKNMLRHQTALRWPSLKNHDLAMSVDDYTYYRNPPYADMQKLPPELLTQEFLNFLAGETPDNERALTYVDEVNAKISDPTLKWIAFPYTSQSVPSLDRKYGRFFVFVPGKDFDRYLQCATPKASACSIVAVQKTDPKTQQPLAIPKVRMVDIWRTTKNGNISVDVNVLLNKGTENCYKCHKEPVLPIHPANGFDEARFGERLKQVNASMIGYGRVEIDGLDMDGYGPSIGPKSSPARTPDLFKKCAPSLDANSQARVQKYMNCAKCHDGQTRAVLNYPAANGDTLVSKYLIQHQAMPPGNPALTNAERSALHECLREEHYYGDGRNRGTLPAWLYDEPCWKAAGGR